MEKWFEIIIDNIFSILSRYQDVTPFARKSSIGFSSADDFGTNETI